MLIFFVGMLTGIVVFVGAIVGGGYALATYFKVGQIASWFNQRDKVSYEIKDMTLFELAKDLFETFSNIGELTLEDLSVRYGYSLVPQFSGIDISPLFKVFIPEIPNSFNKITENLTLGALGEGGLVDLPDDPVFNLLKDGYLAKSEDLDDGRESISDIYNRLTIGDIVGADASGIPAGDGGFLEDGGQRLHGAKRVLCSLFQ